MTRSAGLPSDDAFKLAERVAASESAAESLARERVTIDEWTQLLGLRTGWQGHVCDTEVRGTMMALAAAHARVEPREITRDVKLPGDVSQHQTITRIYCTTDARPLVDAAVAARGLREECVVDIAVDAHGRLRIDALEDAIQTDIALGHRPMAIVASVGAAATSSTDPVARIADVGHAFGCWIHVDGTYGGVAAVVPELRYVLEGVDHADSLLLNPQRWPLTTLHCPVLYTAQPCDVPIASDAQWLERRARTLAVSTLLTTLGGEGITDCIRAHCELARDFAGMVYYEGGWELTAPVALSRVNFRCTPGAASEAQITALNRAIHAQVRARGSVMIGEATSSGLYALQLVMTDPSTTQADIERTWHALRETAACLRGV